MKQKPGNRARPDNYRVRKNRARVTISSRHFRNREYLKKIKSGVALALFCAPKEKFASQTTLRDHHEAKTPPKIIERVFLLLIVVSLYKDIVFALALFWKNKTEALEESENESESEEKQSSHDLLELPF
jgi:hypothetical protein